MESNQPLNYHRYQRYFVDIGRFYQKKKVRVYTGIVLSIFTVAFFLFFAIRPTLVTIAGLLKEIKDKQVVAEKLENKINALYAAQVEYQGVKKDLYLVDEALPVEANVSLFIRQLEALARKNNVSLGSIQFETTTLKGEGESETAQEVKLSLAVAGDYPQLRAFLDALTRLRRLVLIDSFTFQAGKEGKLVLGLKAKAYYLTKK